MVDLSVNFLDVRFKNPIVASAGPLTWNRGSIEKCIGAGASAVIVKSAALDANRWEKPVRHSLLFLDKYDRRQVLAHGGGWYHSFDEEAKLIEDLKPLARKEGVVVIGNIMCDPPAEGFDDQALIRWAKQLERAGADMLELLVGCPTLRVAAGLDPGDAMIQARESIKFVLSTMKNKMHIPYYLKIGYESTAEFFENLKILETGVSACHINPEIRATHIDIDTGKPITPLTKLYGQFNTGVNSFFTAFASKNSNLQILSSGGLWTWRDIVENLMCGATLTGLHTSVLYRGHGLFTRVLDELSSFMAKKDYTRISDFRGIAAPHIDNALELREWGKLRQGPVESIKIVVNGANCNGCGKCLVCVFGAITMRDNIAQIKSEQCMRCGLCSSICPHGAITLSEKM